jgi:predicted  nucleic acid-binding Zn-ribbon protein
MSTSPELNKRNINALAQALRDLDKRLRQLENEKQLLLEKIALLVSNIEELERKVNTTHSIFQMQGSNTVIGATVR